MIWSDIRDCSAYLEIWTIAAARLLMEVVVSGMLIRLGAALMLTAVVTAVVAQQDGTLSFEERAAIERLQNQRAIERMREAQRLDIPRVLKCRNQPNLLVGLDRETLRARCGFWQSSAPVTVPIGADELIYREASGTLLLRIIAERSVLSASAP
jgi:hypothetical protein